MGRRNWVDAFWKNVDRTGDCWYWMGAIDAQGYGHVYAWGRQRGAHRVSFMLAHGIEGDDLPARMVVMHLCDVPSCVNPSHLRLGTPAASAKDWKKKGLWGTFWERRRAVGAEHERRRKLRG